MNLWKQTADKLIRKGYLITDIKYFTINKMGYFWEDFKDVADFEYEEKCGTPYFSSEMFIVMNDGTFFYREEYDGREWWEHICPTATVATTETLTKEMLLYNGY